MRQNIIGIAISFVAILMGLLYYYENFGGGIDPDTTVGINNLTKFFTFFVMLQFWNMFNAKTFGTNISAFKNLFKNHGFSAVALIILLGQFCVVQFGGEIFRTIPLSLSDWLRIIVLTSTVLWIGEIHRAIQRWTNPYRQGNH